MAKLATQWKPSDSGTATAENAGYFLLQENGDYLLLETSDKFLLEDGVISVKNPTSWASPTKVATAWKPSDGFGTFTTQSDTRITDLSDTRITEAGDTRVSEGSILTSKKPTSWSET